MSDDTHSLADFTVRLAGLMQDRDRLTAENQRLRQELEEQRVAERVPDQEMGPPPETPEWADAMHRTVRVLGTVPVPGSVPIVVVALPLPVFDAFWNADTSADKEY